MSIGNFSDADAELDAAFRAAEDGDCARVSKHLSAAGGAGAKARAQLMRQCAGGELHGLGAPTGGIPNGTRVRVTVISPRGKAFTPYFGVVNGVRRNVLGVGSVEYFVEREDGKIGSWVAESFITAAKGGVGGVAGLGRAPTSSKRASTAAGHCDRTVMKKGPKIHGTYCERVITPTKEFAKGSMRTLVFDGGKRVVVIGCPRGQWNAKQKHCKSGTRAHAVLKKVK